MEKVALRTSHTTHAGFASRAVAFVVDIMVMSVTILVAIALVQALLGFFTLYGLVGQRVTQSSPFGAIIAGMTALIGAAIAIGYPVGCWVLFGQTLGKFLMGLRVTRMDGRLLTIRYALLRYVGYWLSALPLGLGFFWVLIDDERQTWHDKLAGSCVTYSSKPLVGERRQRKQPKQRESWIT